MHSVRHLGIILGTLIACPMLMCVQVGSSTHITGPKRQTSTRTNRQELARPPSSDGVTSFRRAETLVDKAAALRPLQTGRHFKLAIVLLQQGASLFQVAHLDLRAADAFMQIGEIYFTQSKYQQALKSYEHALALAGTDTERRCQTLAHIVRVYATTGKSREANTYSRQALSISEGVSTKTQAEVWESRGEALYSLSDFLHAAEHFNRARGLFAEVKDSEGEASTLLMLAWTRFGTGERIEGLQRAREALTTWSSIQNKYGVARARSALGIFSIMSGEFEVARCQSEKALRVFQDAGDKEHASAVLNTLGYISMQVGDLEKSLDYWRRARAAFADIHDRSGEAATISVMGTAVGAMQRYQELPALFAAELRLAQQTHDPARVASALADLAGVYQQKKHYVKAETLYRRALVLYRSVQQPIGESDILILLAQLSTVEGKYFEAISYLEQARPLKEKTGQVEDLAKIDYGSAYIFRSMGRLEDALQTLKRTIDIIESQRLKISAFDSRASYFASVHRYYSLYIQLLMLLHQQNPQGGFLQLAFEASEKSKVRALLDLLTVSEQDSPCDELLRRQLAPEDATNIHTTAASTQVQTLTLKDIQAEVGSEDTVLEYVLGDEKSYVWIVDQTHAVVHELPPAAKIAKLVRAFGEAVTARQPRPEDKTLDEYHQRVRRADAAYRSYLRQLSSLLLPADDLTAAKRLLIVPDGSLQYLPFAALLVPRTNGGKEVLVSQREVVVLPSGSALKTLREAAAKRPPPTSGAAIFADPVFEPDDPRVSQNGKDKTTKRTDEKPATLKIALRDVQGSQHIDRLEGSRVEAENIRKTFRKEDVLVAEDFRASKEYVLQGVLEHYRFLHFATHGIIDPLHPEMSGLILSLISRSGKHQDGYLRLGDIYKLKLSADLVVLSACKSALGKDLESEGIIGLPRGFLYAGARSVIASLWKVDDEATAALMNGLYARMQHGESPSSALRGAQMEMAGSAKWWAPFYWAAFVLQGDYK